MLVVTKVFELYDKKYENLASLARAMGLSVSQVYRVREGKRNINRKFILGAIRAFPEYKFDELFYFVIEPGKEPPPLCHGEGSESVNPGFTPHLHEAI